MIIEQLAAAIRPEPTTAQTIGRLETGVRTLSVDWLLKIAQALDCHLADLIDLQTLRRPVAGTLDSSGNITPAIRTAAATLVDVPSFLQDAVAVEVGTATERFMAGDILVAERLPRRDNKLAIGRDCIAWLPGGTGLLCQVAAGSDAEHFHLTPLARGAVTQENVVVEWLAPLHQLQRLL